MKMLFLTKNNKKMSTFIPHKLKKQKSSCFYCKASNSLSLNQTGEDRKSFPQTSNYQKKNKTERKSGDFLTLTVNSLISKNLGITELPDGWTIFLPNTNLGDQVQAKIIQVNSSTMKSNYAVGEVVRIIKQSQIEPPVSVGEIFDLTINEKGPRGSGKVTFPNNYSLYIPNAILGEKMKVMITRVKIHYAFAKIIESNTHSYNEKKQQLDSNLKRESQTKNLLDSKKLRKNKLIEGSLWNIVLPKTTLKKSNYIVLNFRTKSDNGFFPEEKSENLKDFFKENNLSEIPIEKKEKFTLFVKMGLGAKLGDKVRIQITKIIETSKKNFFKDEPIILAKAKIIKVSPISSFQTQQKTKAYLNKMLKNGIHFGDLKCHASMRKFLWSKKKSFPSFSEQKNRTSVFSLKKKQERIFRKKDRYLLNLLKTKRCLNKAFRQLAKYAASGRTFLFVGTKKPAAGLVARAALLSQNSFFVNTRWLGGMLTNWKTLLKSISKIQPIFREKQKILQNLLEKRHKIKVRLIKKINKLRNQSQQLLKKGKLFVTKIKQERTQNLFDKSLKNSVSFLNKNDSVSKETPLFPPKKLLKKRKQYLQKGTVLLKKSQQLLTKKNLITNSFQILQEKAYQLIMIKKKLIKQYTISLKKLQQLKNLLILSNELQAIKNSFNKDSQSNMKKILTVSSKKFTQLNVQSKETSFPWIVPNPPKEIIQKILNTLQQENNKTFNPSFSEKKSKTTYISPSNEKTEISNEILENKAILFSKFLNKFSDFCSFTEKNQNNFLKNLIKKLNLRIQNQKKLLIEIQEALLKIQEKMIFCLNNKKKNPYRNEFRSK